MDLIYAKMGVLPTESAKPELVSKSGSTTPMPNFALSVPLSRPAPVMSAVDMNLNHELGKMSDEQKAQMVTQAKSLTTKPKWTATNASIDAGATTYKVQAGNTLGQIVADYNKKNGTSLKWQDVAKWSGIADPSKMRIGQVINFADPSIDPVKEEDVKDESVKDVDVKVEDPADSLSVKDPADSLRNSLDSLKMGIVRDSIAVADSISNPALNKTLLANRRNMYDVMRANGFGTPTLTVPKVNIPQVPSNKQGGNMNRINYFQQGGSAQPNSSDAFMQAILQGDPQAVQQLVQEAANGNKQAEDLIKAILEGAQQGNQQVMKAAQAIAAVVQQAQGQATAAKWGAKLGYIRSLKYAKGGKACPACEKAAKVEMKKCGGKKSKRK